MHHGMPFFFWIIIPTIACAICLKFLSDRKKPDASQEITDETRMIQEMYRNLSRMEERIETLETLLNEQNTKDGTR